MNKIQKFIKSNKLDFTGSGSDLNGACVVLAGYALYLYDDDDDFDRLKEDIEANKVYSLSHEAEVELERVFDYAYQNNYFMWWQE